MTSQHPQGEPHDVPRAGSAVTVIEPKPRRVSPVWLALVLGVFVLAVVLVPDLVDLAFSLLLGLLFVIAFFSWIAERSVVRRILRRIPRWRRRSRRARAVERIEVRAERITAVTNGGEGGVLDSANGDLLAVREVSDVPCLYVVGFAGDDVSIDLRRFDADEVGRAAVAHGWRWWKPLPADPSHDETDATEDAGCEIVLRDGRLPDPPIKQIVLAMAVTAGVLAVAGMIAAGRFGLPTWVWYVGVVAIVLFTAGVIVTTLLVIMRLSRCTVAINRRRISVTHGSFPPTVVKRGSAASGRAGKRMVRLRDQKGKTAIWVPLRPKRDEVLSALWSYDWPISDEFGPGLDA